MEKIITNKKEHHSLFGLSSKEKEEEYNFFYYSNKINQTKKIILLTSIVYFVLGILDLWYTDISFNIYIPLKLVVITLGIVFYYSNILNIKNANIYVHIYYIISLIGITIQMYFTNEQFFYIFYSVGFVSITSVLIMLSIVKPLYSIISSIISSIIYLLILNMKINDFQFFGFIFLFLIVFSVALIAALINDMSSRENFDLIKQIEINTNEKIASEIETNKTSITKLQNLNHNNLQLQKTLNGYIAKEKILNKILYDYNNNETKLKLFAETLKDINNIITSDNIIVDDKKTNIDITKKLEELKDNIDINESFDQTNHFDLNQMLNDIALIFRFSAEKSKFKINYTTTQTIQINTDQSKLKQIFISLVNHLFNIGANEIVCTYNLDSENNITFIFNTNRYISDKINLNKLLVPMYLTKLGGEIIELEEENAIAFKIPIKYTETKEEHKQVLNLTNKSVLIIDDDKENLSYLEFVIKNSKAKIYKATNGVEAIEVFKEKNTELQIVIMDINMPGLNGNEAAKFMREINPSIPIILVTAYSFYKGQSTNADKVLLKPFSPKVLIEIISELVN